MIIDPHLHVWSDDEARYPFPGGRPPEGGASVELLNETMANAGVDKAVIVQPKHYGFDNRYIADCLKRFPGKFAAVGLVDPTAPDAPGRLEELVVSHGFGGMRLHLGRYGPPSVLAGPDQDPVWRKAEKLGACILMLGYAEEYAELEPIVSRFPEVNVVIDHLAAVPADEAPPYPLLNILLRFAQYPNVYVKVSNVRLRSKEPYPHRDTFPTIRKVYDAFGPERLTWGSDFPHVIRPGATGYVESLDLIRKEIDFLTEADLEWMLCKTSLKIWRFD